MTAISAAAPVARPPQLRRRAPLVATGAKHRSRLASLVAAGAIAVGYPAIGLGYPGIAGADPNNGGNNAEWDIGLYDFCMSHHPPFYTTEEEIDHHIWCCVSTGGVWGLQGCQAPPGEASAPFGPPRAPAPTNIQAPPPVNPTAPVNPGNFG
jgi:hypothetical protein